MRLTVRPVKKPAKQKPAKRAPSPEAVEAARSPKGGWSRETLQGWGVGWPPPRGWKAELARRHREETKAPPGRVTEILPTVAPRPLSDEEQKRWELALTKQCPRCKMPPGQRCINLAPSHRVAGIAYETRLPHPQR